MLQKRDEVEEKAIFHREAVAQIRPDVSRERLSKNSRRNACKRDGKLKIVRRWRIPLNDTLELSARGHLFREQRGVFISLLRA